MLVMPKCQHVHQPSDQHTNPQPKTMTNSEISMDAIDGTSCSAGSSSAECSFPDILCVPIAYWKDGSYRLRWQTIECHTEATQNYSGTESTYNPSVPCTTTRRREEANENVRLGGVG